MSDEKNFPDDFFKFDSSNYKSFLQGYVEDLRTSYNRPLRSLVQKLNFTGNIFFVGSSWSLNAARIFGDYSGLNLFFAETYSETYNLSKDDVVIAVSYSGNSEEASSWLKHARRAGAKSLIISSGGRLGEDSFDTPVIDLSKGLPSRCSIFSILGTLIRLFEDAGFLIGKTNEVQESVDFLRDQDFSALAIDLSSKLYGVIPLIYATSSFSGVGSRFKRLVNSNAKTSCFFNVLSGADYYEAEGFVTKNASFHALVLSGGDDLSRLKKKTVFFKEALQNQGVSVTELNIKGKGLVKFCSALMLSEYASYFLALRYKQDPLRDSVTKKIKDNMGVFI